MAAIPSGVDILSAYADVLSSAKDGGSPGGIRIKPVNGA
jgi:hypothetical protein